MKTNKVSTTCDAVDANTTTVVTAYTMVERTEPSELTSKLQELQDARNTGIITEADHEEAKAKLLLKFTGGGDDCTSSTQDKKSTGGRGLVIHEARYGWSQNIWSGSCSHQNGCKDVTDILRRNIDANDELHVNPTCAKQYMNQHFWPETAGGPPIPRRLAIRYSYDGGNMHEFQTRAVPHETVALHVTRSGASDTNAVGSSGNQGLIQTKDIAGCWVCACFPFGFACFHKKAISDNELEHGGLLLAPCIFPFCGERRIRSPNSNNFYKSDDANNVDRYSSNSCVCNGPSCSMKLC